MRSGWITVAFGELVRQNNGALPAAKNKVLRAGIAELAIIVRKA